MPKIKVNTIDRKEKYQLFGELFELLAGLKNKKEVIDFSIGLFTPSELLMVARRIQIAKMLLEEDNYEKIRKKLKVSYQTIAKVDHWLRSDDDKNKVIVGKIKSLKSNSKTFSYRDGMLDKYAQHRFFKELFD